MRCRKSPCEECPFRRDTEPGQFPAERYEALRATAPDESGHPRLGEPLFACHKSKEGEEIACAGWLAVCGPDHVTVRLAAAYGELPVTVLQPPDDWPELFDSYGEMAAAQGGGSQKTAGARMEDAMADLQAARDGYNPNR